MTSPTPPPIQRYTCVKCGQHWRTATPPTACPFCGYSRSAPRPDPTPAQRLRLALLLAVALLAACGGGNVGNAFNDAPPPWQLTIEAKCAAPAACPTFPLLDGTPRPTAVTTPNPALPTATPRPLTEAEALATRQPAAMTAAAEGMVARATEEARP